jgi:hypothetical protein
MTLPNRPGYVVEDKHKPQQTQVPQEPSIPMHMGNPHMPPLLHPEQQIPSSLFPYAGQHHPDAGKMVERTVGQMPYNEFQQQPVHDSIHPTNPLIQHAPPRFDPNLFTKQATFMDSISSEEIQARKNYVRTHRLLPHIVEFMTTCKKEGLSPAAEALAYLTETIQTPHIDFGLEDFLVSQGIDTGSGDEEMLEEKSSERDEFLFRLEQLKEKYNEELEKLNRVCSEFCSRLFALLREHATIRPVSEQEIQLKLHGVQQKFDYVKSQLRQNVCNAIVALEKQYNHTKKKRKALPKKAAEVLSNWFFEHLNDPYPSEEEKSILAAAGGLTITQVNNWFGNKRIRYKRKCLEEEAKRNNFDPSRLSVNASSQEQQTTPKGQRRKAAKETDE